jgi:hypothetical protein
MEVLGKYLCAPNNLKSSVPARLGLGDKELDHREFGEMGFLVHSVPVNQKLSLGGAVKGRKGFKCSFLRVCRSGLVA